MAKVLVTGGSGFLGQVLLRHLAEAGHSVTSFSRRLPQNLEAFGVYGLQGDLLDRPAIVRAVQGMDAIFHVGAKAGVWGPWDDYYAANVLGTRHILDAAIQANVPHFIYTSTASVVFNRKPLINADESLPYGSHWLCSYAKSKAMAEAEVLAAARQGLVKSITLRPHLIWGPGDPHLFPRLVQLAKSRKLVQVGPGDNWVDLTHVENVAHAHVLALNALESGRVNGRAYMITQNEPVPLWPWVRGFLKAVGLPPVRCRIPFPVAYAAGGALEAIYRLCPFLTEPSVTRFVALELAKDHTFSSSKAEKELSYTPIVSFAEGMEQMISYWKQQCRRP